MIVNPAAEDRRLHPSRPGLRKNLYPPVQFSSRRRDLAFPMHLAARSLDAVADGLLVNIQSDVIPNLSEEPPWLCSESTFPLSSAFVHHALLAET